MPELFQSRRRVILVEDESLVAIDLQDELEAAGYTIMGPFATCAGALDWLETETPDFALIETMLKDGTCKALAAELARRDIPFVLWSGHRQDEQTLHEFVDAVWVRKPSSHSTLLDALASLKIEPAKALAKEQV